MFEPVLIIPVAVPVKLPEVNAVQSVHEIGVAHTLVETKKTTVKKTRLVVNGLVIFVASSEHTERDDRDIRAVGWPEGPFSDTGRPLPFLLVHAQISALAAACKSPNSVSPGAD